MLADVMSIGTRRREQSVQEDIDVAHSEAVFFPDKVERVVEHAFDIRQMGFFLKLFLVPGRHTEGIDQQSPAAQLTPAAMHQSSPRGSMVTVDPWNPR